MDYLPKDPAILVSSVNMLLRDEEFDTLESFAQQRHEGEGRCPALRLPVHRHHRHRLPSRMGERAFVAITAVS